ncbi:MAG: hypothetical protein JRD89_01970 [Deltaproteobacteria bacterium]|nr:hypothetical protein [Deltaproteobacteria bacterium]
MKLYETQRTITRQPVKIQPEMVMVMVKVNKPGSNSTYNVYSTLHDEPGLDLDTEGAIKYLLTADLDNGWNSEEAETVLAQLRVGDQMIPDERWGGEERLVRTG